MACLASTGQPSPQKPLLAQPLTLRLVDLELQPSCAAPSKITWLFALAAPSGHWWMFRRSSTAAKCGASSSTVSISRPWTRCQWDKIRGGVR